MKLVFEKYEGLGNDFVVVNEEVLTDQAIALCDRHRGIGADGVLFCGSDASGAFMRVINADGSIPEMCGNGLRCAAHYLKRRGLVDSDAFTVHTGAGPHQVWLEDLSEGSASVRVEMNAPDFRPSAIGLSSSESWIDHAWQVGGHELKVTAVSMGNPHLVTFDDVGDDRHALAAPMQHDPRLAHGANVGFCERQSASSFVLRVFERGAGWTQACGTGACAAVAAAVATDRAQRGTEVEVRLPGGSLFITERGLDQPMWMRGPARHVFSGVVSR